MRVLREGKVAVDFIGNHEDSMLLAEGAKPLQFLRAPNPAHGIVRGAEQEELDLMGGDFFFQIGKIDLISSLVIDEFTFYHNSMIVLNDGE